MQIRFGQPADFAAISTLTTDVYGGEQLAGPEYLPTLADVAGRAAHSELLVAVDHDVLLGSVAFARHGSPYAEITAAPDEAAFRMLAVAATARKRGIGEALVRACAERAAAAGVARLVISTDPAMYAAHRLYERLGFRREPTRDWSPMAGVSLWCYSVPVAGLISSAPVNSPRR